MTDLRFGRYEALFRIGLGGMAEVYAARMRGEGGFQKLVAVKRMLPHLTGDQKFVDMFLDEARLAANIVSPHVAQTFDLGRSADESLYIVMELIVGVNLTHFLVFLHEQQRLIDVGLGVEILAQAAQGLDDAHEARTPTGESLRLVHRDISPQNIMVGLDGRVRVTDFGIAQALHLRTTQTQAGEKKGKYSYFAPEQAFGRPVDRRTDIFALAVVAWELLLGRRLFPGTPLEALEAVRDKEIELVHTLRPEVPESVSKVVARGLERDPEKRFASAAEFAHALRTAYQEHRPLPAGRELGAFVAEAGGEWLEQLRGAIATADSSLGSSPPPHVDESPSTSEVWLALSESRRNAEAAARTGGGGSGKSGKKRKLAEALAHTVASSVDTGETSVTPSGALHDLETHPVPLPDLSEEPSEQGTRTMVAAAEAALLEKAARSSAPPQLAAGVAPDIRTRRLTGVDEQTYEMRRPEPWWAGVVARVRAGRVTAEAVLVERNLAADRREAGHMLWTFGGAFVVFFVFALAVGGSSPGDAEREPEHAQPGIELAPSAAEAPATTAPARGANEGEGPAENATTEVTDRGAAADTQQAQDAAGAAKGTAAPADEPKAAAKPARSTTKAAARERERKKANARRRRAKDDSKLPGLERWQ